jgi:tetratricopeptide (TPR) repeat protein
MSPFASRVSAFLLLAASCVACGGKTPDANAARSVAQDRNPTLLTERGKAYAEAGDLVRAEQYFQAALAAGADERVVTPMLIRVCVASRHFRLASELAELMLARNPADSRLRFLAGALAVSIGAPARARPHLERAANELSNDGEVQFAVAVFFRDDLADRATADKYFRDYLRLQRDGAHAAEARASLMERVQ